MLASADRPASRIERAGGGADAAATTEVLRSWDVTDEERVYEVLLVCSELVGNAVRHCGRRVALRLSLDAAVLTVEVSDGSAALPAQRSPGLEESGRGMTIVEALVLAWGVRTDDDGKTVWATVSVAPSSPSTQEQADERAST